MSIASRARGTKRPTTHNKRVRQAQENKGLIPFKAIGMFGALPKNPTTGATGGKLAAGMSGLTPKMLRRRRQNLRILRNQRRAELEASQSQ